MTPRSVASQSSSSFCSHSIYCHPTSLQTTPLRKQRKKHRTGNLPAGPSNKPSVREGSSLARSIDETGPSSKRLNRGVHNPNVLVEELISPANESRISRHVRCNSDNPALPDVWNDQKVSVKQMGKPLNPASMCQEKSDFGRIVSLILGIEGLGDRMSKEF
ncbi:hypothetical protein F5883DRAFT_595242 [Diaporthe sp. PMI_573]|nr:hypothetical protein F5883DRAFT_595242 [Diaporthaceae sp. PMI_573]